TETSKAMAARLRRRFGMGWSTFGAPYALTSTLAVSHHSAARVSTGCILVPLTFVQRPTALSCRVFSDAALIANSTSIGSSPLATSEVPGARLRARLQREAREGRRQFHAHAPAARLL